MTSLVPRKAASTSASSTVRRVALLIDADNVAASTIDEVVAQTSRLGALEVRRAYGDWSNPALKPWKAVLHGSAIQPIQQFAHTPGKNAADIALAIDAMELLFTRALDVVAIASSDADFTPLATRLRSHGLEVHGFGESKTPQPFVDACTVFHRIGAAGAAIAVAPESRREMPRERLVAELRRVVATTARGDGWAPMSAAGSTAVRTAAIVPRDHGVKTFTALFAMTGAFDLVRTETGEAFVSDRRDETRKAAPGAA